MVTSKEMVLTYLYLLINQIAKNIYPQKIGNRYKTEHQDCKGAKENHYYSSRLYKQVNGSMYTKDEI